MRKEAVEQRQEQVVHIASAEHGMTDEVKCAYVDWLTAGMPSWQQQKAMQMRSIKILFFKGKVQRVFCHHLVRGDCTSNRNPQGQKRCFMLDSE